jgi:hypothetical protein
VPEPSASEVKMAIEKLKRHKPPGTDQGPEELISRGRTIRSGIHKLINSICNEVELAQEWKESSTVPIYKKGEVLVVIVEASLLSTTNKMLSNILLPRLTPCAQEIIKDHQCAFRRSRSNT